MFSCPIRVHSWFKHCLDYVFVHSCPFAVLPLPPPSCFFVCFVLFAVQTLLGLRFFAHSCPFVSIRGSPSSPFFVFFVLFVYFVVQTLLGLRFFAYSCPFVSIRVHSWFSLVPPPSCFFRVFRVFRGSNTAWTTFLHIRVHSCPFVVQSLLGLRFFVHSYPFVSIRGSNIVFRVFRAFRG